MQNCVYNNITVPDNVIISELSRYILPIFLSTDETTFVGTAFCIDNYLITAGHVVSDFRTYFVKDNDKFYELSPYNWLKRLTPTTEKTENDIAIYPMPNLKSALSIAQYRPQSDSEANVICWQKANDSIQRIMSDSLIIDNNKNDNFNTLATTQRITYCPACCTPLYDAMGVSLTKLRKSVAEEDVVLVTVITDGYENASHEYNGQAIKSLVESLKAKGWVFTYIGANQDVERVAATIAINNTLSFSASAEGTKAMFAKDSSSRERFFSRLHRGLKDKLSDNFFDDDD